MTELLKYGTISVDRQVVMRKKGRKIMILKFARNESGWTFIDDITYVTVDKNPLQTKDDHYTCMIRMFHNEEERIPLCFQKEDAVYLLNNEGKTIENLN